MFDALVFAIPELGFVARSAREEEDDGGEFRLARGLEIPPDQKTFQTVSTWLRISPVSKDVQ